MSQNKLIYVTRPIVPESEDLAELISSILKSRRLTNGGPIESHLRLRLSEIMRVPRLSLVCNGTVALQLGAKALDMSGRVACSPFTFVATLSALLWIGIEPVLVDIEDEFMTLDPEALEDIATEEVSGIVGVHVYGNPCDVNRIENIANRNGLPVLYDAAHVFDGAFNGQSIMSFGDASATSFHATKLFNTCEGGAVIARNDAVAARIAKYKNFGIVAEDDIEDVGINAKMSELNAAFGLAVLEQMGSEKAARREVISTYNDAFKNQDLVRVVGDRPGLSERLQYYVIRIPGHGRRDAVYDRLREKGVFARRYFYPSLSEVPAIAKHLSHSKMSWPVAERAAKEVLALPIHSGVTLDDAARIAAEVIDGARGRK